MTRLIINTDATGSIPPEQAKQIREFVAAHRNRPVIIDADAVQAQKNTVRQHPCPDIVEVD